MVHAVILALGVFWIFQIIPEKKQEVDFIPKGGGGGQPGAKAETNMKKRATMTTMNAPRLAAKGASSSFTLPEPDPASATSSVGALGSSGMAAGLGGSGSGGGKGSGKGKGFGDGMGPGMGGGAGKMNPFGALNPNANALVGTFYNLNHRSSGEVTDTDNAKQAKIIHDFVTRNWNEIELNKFLKAPQKLYQTKIYLPAMNAAEAPSAFGLTPDPHPRWIVVYRGTLTAEKTTKFRFVGAGDDTMVVRFNGRNVFDFGYNPGTIPLDLGPFKAALRGKERFHGALHDCPMEPPVTFYTYPTTVDWNGNLGGLAAGPEQSVVMGHDYPVEILIAEGCGGLFAASLLMEETGATYERCSTGAPILPLFRTDASVPSGVKGDNTPPYDPKGPVWKVNSAQGFRDI